jgi:hypothetical protein
MALVRWTAVVRWSERELAGAVAVASGASDRALSDTALTSWFVREADSRGTLLREQHSGETHLAVPIREHGSTAGYFVVVVETPPRHLELALGFARVEIAQAFAPLCVDRASGRLVAAS